MVFSRRGGGEVQFNAERSVFAWRMLPASEPTLAASATTVISARHVSCFVAAADHTTRLSISVRGRDVPALAAEPFPAEWLAIVRANCRHFAMLSDAEQTHLLRDTRWFLDEKSIEAAVGLIPSDEIRVTIAAQASLLGLGFAEPPFDRLMTVFVQAESYTGRKVYRESSGLELHSDEERLGEAWRNGPVVLSWRDIVQQCREAPDGRNVILHEFAHLLDMANHDVDGVPPLDNEQQYRTWLEVTGAEYQRLVRQSQLGRATLLDEYGATSPVEFFAVATESFFEQPVEMSQLHTRLYDVLRAFYKQDPASRVGSSRGAGSV